MNKAETTTLGRVHAWYRPYSVNNKDLESIVIYKDGEILIKTRSGWLEEVGEDFRSMYNGDLKSITFDGSVKRANKLNLNRKDNFLFKWKENACIHDGYTLFIYADNIFSNYIELPKKYDLNDSKEYYLYGYRVTFKYPFKQDEMYFKYYNAGDKLEPEDVRRRLYNPVLRDENGKIMRDENGEILHDESRYYVTRSREIETQKEIVIYNGLYIKEGK